MTDPSSNEPSKFQAVLEKATQPILPPENGADAVGHPGDAIRLELHEGLLRCGLLFGGMVVILVILFAAMGKVDKTGRIMEITFVSVMAVLAAFSIASCVLLGKSRKSGRYLAYVPVVVSLVGLIKGNTWGIRMLGKLSSRDLTAVLK